MMGPRTGMSTWLATLTKVGDQVIGPALSPKF